MKPPKIFGGALKSEAAAEKVTVRDFVKSGCFTNTFDLSTNPSVAKLCEKGRTENSYFGGKNFIGANELQRHAKIFGETFK